MNIDLIPAASVATQLMNKNPRRRAAAYFCSPGELHCGFNTPLLRPKLDPQLSMA
ncbi:MAG: hypothetical protein Ta2F_18760 [Termitinemataceae bacterium]|nr:MAG: hypothetical protein Ta2F_18760 [Termitinemataceae bacterium]